MASLVKLVLLLIALTTEAATFGLVEEADPLQEVEDYIEPNLVELLENEEAEDDIEPDLVELLKNLNLNVFYDNVEKAGLVDELKTEGSLTVIAPTNTAFIAMPLWQKRALNSTTLLVKVMKYHLLQDEMSSDTIANEMLVPTFANMTVRFNIYNKLVTAQCSPIDHQRKDKMASNGVLHVIRRVMVPPYGTVVDVLSACPAFTTLIQALHLTGLLGLLSGDGPFTLFAPTDEAFAGLSEQTRDFLFSHPAFFTDLLLYHVVNGTYCRASFCQSTNLATINNGKLMVSISDGAVHVNTATVPQDGADGSATNGVVHSIDKVLSPFSSNLRSSPESLNDIKG